MNFRNDYCYYSHLQVPDIGYGLYKFLEVSVTLKDLVILYYYD